MNTPNVKACNLLSDLIRFLKWSIESPVCQMRCWLEGKHGARKCNYLFCFHRERQEQLMGYRKRGPKPKHLLLQVIIIFIIDESPQT